MSASVVNGGAPFPFLRNTNYVPNNGMLEYQVHGITWDRRYTIRAQFGITHPRLTEFGPKVRYHDPPGTSNGRWLDPAFVSYSRSGTYFLLPVR